MSRYIVIAVSVNVADSSGTRPGQRYYQRGQVVELSAAEVTLVGSSNLRALSATAGDSSNHDTMGESVSIANSSP